MTLNVTGFVGRIAGAVTASHERQTRQRGIAAIEFMLVFAAYVAVVISAAVYGGKMYGRWGFVVGLVAGAGFPFAIAGVISILRRSAALVNLVWVLLPCLAVVYLFRPDVLLLKLAAVASVIMVCDVLFQGLYSWTSSTGKADGFDLHFGHFLLVIVVGTVLAVWWGWRSTAIVLLVDGAWQGLAGLADRRILAGLPPGDSKADDSAPTETEGSTEL